jgi:hypothetical protein
MKSGMKFRTLSYICFAVIALLIARVAPAYQAEDSAKQVSKKAKKAAKDAADATGKAAEPGAGAASQAGSTATEKTKKATSSRTHVKNASAAEIDAAKASGKVWVNTDSGVYHKGGQYYGATKQGKFMTEQEAIKGGYRAAKN